MSTAKRHRGGFSLVELVIVIMIIGVLSAIAVPRLGNFSGNAEVAAVAEHLQRLETAFMYYYAENQAWPADVNPGVLPSEMAHMLSDNDFTGSPLGGTYDWQEWITLPQLAGGAHVSVQGVQDWDAAQRVDALIDDGDLDTGAVFRHSHFLLLALEK